LIYYRRNDLKYSRRKGYAVTPPRAVDFITKAKKPVCKDFLTPNFNKRLLFAIADRKYFFCERRARAAYYYFIIKKRLTQGE